MFKELPGVRGKGRLGHAGPPEMEGKGQQCWAWRARASSSDSSIRAPWAGRPCTDSGLGVV